MSKIWKRSFYLRKGSKTLRNRHTGAIINNKGRFLGQENTYNHFYSEDAKKTGRQEFAKYKKNKVFRGGTYIIQSPQKKAIMANLRRKGKI